ncbi:MAG: hypothetical protein ACI9KN_002500, partial [Gammaproteobacteria bacterium]
GVIGNINPKEIVEHIPLAENDKILMFSDGLTEARNGEGEIFGDRRLEQGLSRAPKDGVFGHIFDLLDNYCGTTTQMDDVTLIEITCVHEIIPANEISKKVATHKLVSSKGEWNFSLTFIGKRLQETNPVPILISQIMEVEGFESERQAIFTVMTELYLNALDHGVLGLSSSLKSDPSGFTQYFTDRESRLSTLDSGFVSFDLSSRQCDGYRDITLRVEDSGDGFDHQNYIPPAADEIAYCGRGIVLIEDFCESLIYEGKGNIASVVFRTNSV